MSSLVAFICLQSESHIFKSDTESTYVVYDVMVSGEKTQIKYW